LSLFQRLQRETASDRDAFVAIPLIQHTVAHGASKDLYLAYLVQAYHHVKHTCGLLALAASRCRPDDRAYQDALFDYIEEERGHDLWILEDIAALGGDIAAVRGAEAGLACKLMVAYAYYGIDHVSPYSLLGMVHVLEGMSVLLARKAAAAIGRSLDVAPDQNGFKYLTSHGALDEEHVEFFEKVVNRIEKPAAQKAVIDTARVMYRLFGDIFRDLGNGHDGTKHEARG